jgi:Flp pilus assembly protein TadG
MKRSGELAMKMQKDQDGQAAARRRKHSAAPGGFSGKVRHAGAWLLARFCRSDVGQSIVELALIMPVLLALIMGLYSIGMGMIVYEQLGEAAFAGDQAMAANEGVFNAGTTTPTDLCANAYTAVTTVLAGGPNWSTANLAKITYSATLAKTVGSTTTTTNIPASTGSFSCSAQSIAGDLGPKSQVTLTLQYSYPWLPIINPVTTHLMNLGSANMTTQQSVLAF